MRRQVLLLIVLAAGCDRGDRHAAPGESAGAAETGPAHRVEITPPAPCRVGEACSVAVRLTALRNFKVNPDYPIKFVPTATDGVTLEPGVFALDGKQAGTMTVGFRAAGAGTIRVSGTLKLSVCSDDECRIEQEPVSIDVPVGA